jgi:hypothetical protein
MKIGKFFVLTLLLIFPIMTLAATPAAPSILEINENNAIVAGVTPKDTEVIVYVDDNFFGLAEVTSSQTQSDNFNFSLFGLFPKGEHEIKVAAKDRETKSLSKFSAVEIIQITDKTRKKPKISQTAVIEESNQLNDNNNQEDEEEYLLDINDLPETSEVENKSEKDKNILRWNLAIFILFLIAIISWIFWVNHELKKEKEEGEEKEEKE